MSPPFSTHSNIFIEKVDILKEKSVNDWPISHKYLSGWRDLSRKIIPIKRRFGSLVFGKIVFFLQLVILDFFLTFLLLVVEDVSLFYDVNIMFNVAFVQCNLLVSKWVKKISTWYQMFLWMYSFLPLFFLLTFSFLESANCCFLHPSFIKTCD